MRNFIGALATMLIVPFVAVAADWNPRIYPASATEGIATHTVCKNIHAPSATITVSDDIPSIFRAPAPITITRIWCEAPVGGVLANLQNDDGSPVDIATADLTCDSTPPDACASGCTTTLVTAETAVAADDTIDLDIVGVATSPTDLAICFDYTYD